MYIAVIACVPRYIRYIKIQQEKELCEYYTTTNAAGAMDTALDDWNNSQQQGTRREGGGGPGSGGGDGITQPLLNRKEYTDYGSLSGSLDQVIEYPASEQAVRRAFYALGMKCATRPWRTLAICAACVMMCTLGVVRLRVLTDPVELWVGPGSLAAEEKAQYEAAFGQFYRITQLILSTTTSTSPSSSSASIFTDENVRLLFDVQDAVDALRATTSPSNTNTKSATTAISLDDVCFKPLGNTTPCATMSVLQYWSGKRENYEAPGRLSPEYCLTHWSTSCRAATGAPVDPRIVLGGFPRTTSNATSYLQDATAFVVTYPLLADGDKRSEVVAWERSFIELASTVLVKNLTERYPGLSLSFSTERSVEDELSRESMMDVGTVGLSYMLMLVYVAVALSTIPLSLYTRRIHGGSDGGGGAATKRGMVLDIVQTVLIHGRASLALGGVSLVGMGVGSALGICGWIGVPGM